MKFKLLQNFVPIYLTTLYFHLTIKLTDGGAAFDCAQMAQKSGMYADVNAGCQAYHVCDANGGGSGSTFYCPRGTLFNQRHFVCDWWYNVNCADAHRFYALNSQLHAYPSANSAADIFSALHTVKNSASVAVEQAYKALGAAQIAKNAADFKQFNAQREIEGIRAAAKLQLESTHRSVQSATQLANERAAAAYHAAQQARLDGERAANRIIDQATALRAKANVKFAVASATDAAAKKVNSVRLQLAISDLVRQAAIRQQLRAAAIAASLTRGTKKGY